MALQSVSFFALIEVHNLNEILDTFPQTQMNSIGEKMILEQFVGVTVNYLNIRRLPMDSSVSEDELWNKNMQNLPSINLF